MMAAMTGPTPKMPVKVVPDAATAATGLLRVSRRWASRSQLPPRAAHNGGTACHRLSQAGAQSANPSQQPTARRAGAKPR
jgi:hypothetical protein